MSDTDPRVAIAALQERIGAIDAKAAAAHGRVDRLENGVREDLKEMKEQFLQLTEELKPVIAWMNKVNGWAAAMMLASGLFGSILTFLITRVLLK